MNVVDVNQFTRLVEISTDSDHIIIHQASVDDLLIWSTLVTLTEKASNFACRVFNCKHQVSIFGGFRVIDQSNDCELVVTINQLSLSAQCLVHCYRPIGEVPI